MSIDRLPPGTVARLTAIGGEGSFRRRLLEMGFLPGTVLRVVRRIEVGGVIEIELRGCRVSLNTSEAKALLTRPGTAGTPAA
ncbi:MAG: ferrous iron transport protein A [Planctomycetes bacterium]|nr:ferrous iron transport protein A [Planctomycetota bacterium]